MATVLVEPGQYPLPSSYQHHHYHPPPHPQGVMERPVPERPKSALARGVQITEFKENKVNPEPVVVEETDVLLEDYLSPRKLRDLTGVERLEEIHFLEMKVDTTETSLGNFGAMLPQLSQLKLSNSLIASVRDLGSSLESLHVLWMARCGLWELDGLSSMSSLKELYLAYNEISDISACSMLDNLQTLDLEGNNIDDISQTEFLALCSSLRNLTLEGNPICLTPEVDSVDPNYDYRAAVKKAIPHLAYLDDESLVSRSSSQNKNSAVVFEDDWALIEELMAEGAVAGSTDTVENTTGRPGSAVRPSTGYRPGSALKQLRPGSGSMRPLSASRRPQTSASGRPKTSLRPNTGTRPTSSDILDETDDASELTVGNVVCGNPSKALKARQTRTVLAPTPSAEPPSLFAQHRHVPEKSGPLTQDKEEDVTDILNELKQWKISHESRKKKIEAERAPQVLKIDYDEAVSLTEDDDSDGEEDEIIIPLDEGRDLRRSTDSQDTGIAASESFELSPSPPALPQDSPSSPHPPTSEGSRLKSSDRRMRRFRKLSSEPTEGSTLGVRSPQQRQQQLLYRTHDESFDAEEDEQKSSSLESLRIRSPSLPQPPSEETRPFSGPVIGSGKFRLEPRVNKNEPKVIDKTRPVIRASITPEKLVNNGPRAFTARAALAQPPLPQPMRIRRQLPKVPSLPSRPTMPKPSPAATTYQPS